MTSTTSETRIVADPNTMTPKSGDTAESRVAALTKVASAPKRDASKSNGTKRTAPKRTAPTAAPIVKKSKTVKSDGPTKTSINHAVCARIMIALRADSSKISDAQLRKLNLTREQYVSKISEYMDYLPVALTDWDVQYFGHKMGRGGRPTTVPAAPPPVKVARKRTTTKK